MESGRICQKYKDRIPVICEKDPRSKVPNIDKQKYLVPKDITVGQFMYIIRQRIRLPPEDALYLFVNDMIPQTASLMSTVFEEQKVSRIVFVDFGEGLVLRTLTNLTIILFYFILF